MTAKSGGESLRLVLDEMFALAVAEALRERGHPVVAVAEREDLRSMSDEDVYAWVSARGCWLLTENVKDFRPILLRALQSGATTTGVLFTSARTFPRSRRDLGPLLNALDGWLTNGPPPPPVVEDWLVP